MASEVATQKLNTKGLVDTSAMVSRPRLLKRLKESRSKTVLVCGPSGYGKSVLLSQWAGADPRRFHSVLLAGHHNDPTALVRSLAQAFDPGEPLSDELDEALTAPHPDLANVVLPRLTRAVASRREPFVLVLDEVERLESPESLAVVAELCAGVPADSQLALASRTPPDIHLARMRANRCLEELRREDLEMSRAECGALIEGLGISLTATQLDALVSRTEGWPAAVYLAGTVLGESADLDRAVLRFTGDDRHLVEYIKEELLLEISPRRLDFLLRASVLERMSGELCDAVLQRQDSATVLRDLSRSNMLVLALDRRDRWFRFHPLLREMLSSELRRSDPGVEGELHTRASRWWESQDAWDLAIQHAVKAGATARAGRLIWEATPEYMTRGRNATILAWLDHLKSSSLEQSPGLSLTASWAHLTFGRGPEAEHWAALTRRLLDAEGDSEYGRSLKAGLALHDAALAKQGIDTMRPAIDEARALLADDSPWQTLCCYLDGSALHLSGHPRAARVQLREGNRRGAVGAPNLQALCLAQLALLDADQGDWHEAELQMARARGQIERTGIAEYPMIALPFAVSAFVRARRGAMEAAASDLRSGIQRLGELESWIPWYECETRIVLSGAAARLGDTGRARQLLDAAARQLRELGETAVLTRWVKSTERILDRQSASAAKRLTIAELRILQQLPTRLSIPEIAAATHVSPNTVKTHVRSIYSKFGVSSRRGAIAHAERNGLLDREALPGTTMSFDPNSTQNQLERSLGD